MWHKVLVFCIVVVLCNAASGQNLDSIFIKAYAAESYEESLQEFAVAEKLCLSDTSKARYLYFKYFYFYRTGDQDSIRHYERLALPKLKATHQLNSYFTLRKNRYWLIEDAGESKEAIVLAKELIAEAETLGQFSQVTQFYGCLSNSYHNISFYEKGIEEGKIGYQKAQDIGLDDNYSLSILLNSIAINFDDWNKPDSAIYYHRKVLALENLEELDKRSTYNNIGNTFMKMGALDSADLYISKSLKLSIAGGDYYNLATVYDNKGDLYLRKDQLDQAKLHLDSAQKYAQLSLSIEKMRDVNNTFHRYYEHVDSAKLALHHLELYHLYKDSMVNSEKLQVIKNIETEALKLEQEKALARRNLWIIAAIAAVVILLILLRQLVLKRKQQVQNAQLEMQEERLRISRDLHDNIGAELSYMSSLIDQKLYKEQDQEKRNELSELGNSSKSAMTQLRETIWAIQTEEITLDKFKDKLTQLSRRYADNLDVNLSISRKGLNHLLNPSQAINVFRISQEAINNSFKYSESKNITIVIEGLENEANVSISDTGVGFNLDDVRSGYGLNNMTERAQQLGGRLKVFSEINKGTTIKIVVPL